MHISKKILQIIIKIVIYQTFSKLALLPPSPPPITCKPLRNVRERVEIFQIRFIDLSLTINGILDNYFHDSMGQRETYMTSFQPGVNKMGDF